MTGPWWGWDPNGGPEAVDNGDGTWTVTLDPAPTESMEYLWVVDGTQESLVAAAAAGECTAEIDAGAFVTDYSSYANRKHVLGSGDVTDDVYAACDGTPASATGIVADMSGIFDGFTYDEATSTYSWPSTAAAWAGVANDNAALYPINFTEAGKITFKASAPNGDVVVRFRFEKNPYPDVEPFYNTTTVTVSGATETEYQIDVPAQGTNTFRSFLMYLDTRDVEVVIKDVTVFADEQVDTGNGGGVLDMNEAFGGFVIGETTTAGSVTGRTYTHPAGAESWAGVAHDPTKTDVYPMKFPNGGKITADMAGLSGDVQIMFKAEASQNSTTKYETPYTTISAAGATYEWDVPATSDQYNNFLLYVIDKDTTVVVGTVTVTPNE